MRGGPCPADRTDSLLTLGHCHQHAACCTAGAVHSKKFAAQPRKHGRKVHTSSGCPHSAALKVPERLATAPENARVSGKPPPFFWRISFFSSSKVLVEDTAQYVTYGYKCTSDRNQDIGSAGVKPLQWVVNQCNTVKC